MGRRRLDVRVAELGLAESRSRAQALVMAGRVTVDGAVVDKAGTPVGDEQLVEVVAPPRYVSRGGEKLETALRTFAIDVTGERCLDVGASTGGFTDCLLQHGAEHVVALDVAYGELDWRLRTDDRVTVVERTNARAVRPEDLPYAPDLVVADVSFISLSKVLPAVLACCASRFDALAMVKPQFEVGRAHVGKGGVVRDAADRRAALVRVSEAARALGAAVLGYAPSGLPGPKGNLETFVWLAEGGRAGALANLDAAAAAVEV